MFEQSILIDHTGARKTGALALSLTAQILLGGVLLLAPLVYQDALPKVNLNAMLQMPAFARAPEPPPTKPISNSRATGLSVPNVFRPPTRAPQTVSNAGATVIYSDAPGLDPIAGGVGDFAPIGAATALNVERPLQTVKPPTVAAEPPKLMSVSGGVQSAKLVKQVVPIYPPLAIRMRASGTVHLLGLIAKDGTIQKLKVLSGNPLLTQAALDAVSQWVYSPTILSGSPVEVEAPIDVIFTLSR